MAEISPPSNTIKYLESIIANFFWGRVKNKRKYNSESMETMSLPFEKGGVGIRRLTYVCTALQYKQWWLFRAKSSLWSQFFKNPNIVEEPIQLRRNLILVNL